MKINYYYYFPDDFLDEDDWFDDNYLDIYSLHENYQTNAQYNAWYDLLDYWEDKIDCYDNKSVNV